MRQQEVLDCCDGAEEECWDGDSRNGRAAACAAANERSGGQRLPVVVALPRMRPVVMAPMVRAGSSERSEEEDLNGGAASCAAATDTRVWEDTMGKQGCAGKAA